MNLSAFLSPDVLRNRYPLYAQMRQFQPIMFLPDYRLWLAFRYDDVRNILSDYETFSSDFTRTEPEIRDLEQSIQNQTGRPMGASLIISDPPIHRKLRDLVTRAFTPKAVDNLEPRIEELSHEMIDAVIERGEFDLIRDLAYPLPVTVIAEMLGVPAEDHAQFKRWSDQVVASADLFLLRAQDEERQKQHDESRAASLELRDYFKKIIKERRAHPQDDLISSLIAAEIDNERLTEQDLLGFCTLLLIAGNVTTTNLIGNAIITLLDNPDELARLRADMNLLPSAIEEALRYTSPVQSMFRLVMRDINFGGQEMHAGDRVLVWMGSANRDESKFPDADSFDITRQPNAHIAFGFGIHYCLGAPLARLESRIVLKALLDRMQNLERVNDELLEVAESILLNGVTTLPLRFTPQPRFATAAQ